MNTGSVAVADSRIATVESIDEEELDYEELDYPADELSVPDDEQPSPALTDTATQQASDNIADIQTGEKAVSVADRHKNEPSRNLTDGALTYKNDSQHSKADYSSLQEDDTVEQIIRKQSPAHSVRLALTYLLFLLVPACILTLIALPAYHFLLATFWLVLFCLFASLVWFVQHDVIHKRALHPYIHAAYDAVVKEYHDFCADWKQHVLTLTEHGEKGNEAATAAAVDVAADPKQKRRRPKIKSKVFKVMVKPFLPMLKRRNRRSTKEHVVADEKEGTNYVPAPDGSALV